MDIKNMQPMKFYPRTAQDVLDIVEKLSDDYSDLNYANSVEELRDYAKHGVYPMWFTVSNDSDIETYVVTNTSETRYERQIVNEYPTVDIDTFLGKTVIVNAVRHPHADLIEWFMSSFENRIEFKSNGGWTEATCPNWAFENEYRKLISPTQTVRDGYDAIVQWANDQSKVLQVFDHDTGIWTDEYDIKYGITFSSSDDQVRIKPEFTELELQAQEIVNNPELLALIRKAL